VIDIARLVGKFDETALFQGGNSDVRLACSVDLLAVSDSRGRFSGKSSKNTLET
jgi:hypothetical protein